MKYSEAQQELINRGFKHSYDGLDREYWVRTDGKPDIFLDHSATLTILDDETLISDFVELQAQRKTPLQQMIDLWEGIVRLHNDDLSRPVENTTLAQFTRDDRLKAKAQMVLAALVHYQIELER